MLCQLGRVLRGESVGVLLGGPCWYAEELLYGSTVATIRGLDEAVEVVITTAAEDFVDFDWESEEADDTVERELNVDGDAEL